METEDKQPEVRSYCGSIDEMPDDLKKILIKDLVGSTNVSATNVLRRIFRDAVRFMIAGFAVGAGALAAFKLFGN